MPLAAALALYLAPHAAAAQGTCRCNQGCHQYPGQCVQRGSDSNCAPGYAPFCGTRASTCPQTGWVTCNGECACVRIGPTDAGTTPTDAGTTPADAGTTPADVPASMRDVASTDVVASRDAPGTDVVSTMDVPASFDAARPDGAPPADAPVTPSDTPVVSRDVPATPTDTPIPPSDTPVTPIDAPIPFSDAPVTPADASTTPVDAASMPDAGCVCDGGVCLHGVCLTERCRFQNELGFICPLPDHTCRLVGDEAWCAPACLDVSCEAGSFCDPSTGTCRVDECATIRCPTGQVCIQNRCLPAPSGAADGAVGDASTTAPAVDNGGCGCRTTSRGPNARPALLFAALAALRLRRRARR